MNTNKQFLQTPLWNGNLPMEARLDYLLGELTLEEKFQCLGNGNPVIERLGMPAFGLGGEGAHGLQARNDQGPNKGKPQPTTVFSNPIGMSASWDTEYIKMAGGVTGDEARAVYNKRGTGCLSLWAPTVDMERDPRWGRTEEAYGEDPFLAGKMASAYVQGMQGNHPKYLKTAATLKHFYANNMEKDRVFTSSTVTERNKWEYYLEPFRRVLTEGKAEAVMTAYNEINGVPAILNHEVKDLLKERWGAHHIVCDGGDFTQTVTFHHTYDNHAESIAASIKAGIDSFSDDIKIVAAAAKEAYEKGLLTEKEIDSALRHHFSTLIRLGFFNQDGDNPYDAIGEEKLNSQENQNISRKMAAKSVVMLKNQKNSLPLAMPEKEEELAVIGPLADVCYKDWYSGIPPYYVTPLEGMEHAVGKKLPYSSARHQVKIACGKGKYFGILEDGKTVGAVEKEKADLFEVELWDDTQITLRCVKNGLLLTADDGRDDNQIPRSQTVLATKKEAFGWFVKERFLITVEETGKTISSLQKILEKQTSLSMRTWSGKSLYFNEQDVLCVDENVTTPLSIAMEMVFDGLQDAVELAKKSGQVVVVLGPNPMINCKEEIDRKNIQMPVYQRELLQAIHKVNKNIVLVMVSSVPFLMDWEQENIPAILLMATGSMELGSGLADILFGKENVAGRLNMTWYGDESELPDISDYDIIGSERTYQYFRGKVLYPFGHGLTWAPMEYSDLCIKNDGRGIVVSFAVKNVGARESDEVAQVYVHKENSAVKRPLRQLKGFERILALSPGETKKLEFTIPIEELAYYNEERQAMLVDKGRYLVEVGASSRDIRLQGEISL